MKIDGDHNIEHSGAVAMVVKASWSRRRAWHGEKVTMAIRTELIKDGTGVNLYVRVAAADLGIERLGSKIISGSKLDHEYTISWKDFVYGDEREFVVRAVAAFGEGNEIMATSPPLRIDLDNPVFSA